MDAVCRRLVGSRTGAWDVGKAYLWRPVSAGSASQARPYPGVHPLPPHTVRAGCPQTACRHPSSGGLQRRPPYLPGREQYSSPRCRSQAWGSRPTARGRRASPHCRRRRRTYRARTCNGWVELPPRQSWRHPRMIGWRLATSATTDPRKRRRRVALRIWLRTAFRALWPGPMRGTQRPLFLALTFVKWQPSTATPACRISPMRGFVG